MRMLRFQKPFITCLSGAVAALVILSPLQLHGQSAVTGNKPVSTEGPPLISVGADPVSAPVSQKPARSHFKNEVLQKAAGRAVQPPVINAPPVGMTFDGFDFDDNPVENLGSLFIPPDPIGAAGPGHVVGVVNTMIEWRTKTGLLQFRDALADFFAPVAPTTRTFDPKVIYDQYAGRFVVVTLERFDSGVNPHPSNKSRIYVAVSDDADPNGTWYYHAIDSKTTIGGTEYWADYPGFAIDEEAVYITNNMFAFLTGAYGGVRLWIVAKGAGTGGFYDGGAASVGVYNPYAAAGIATTTQPAHVFGAGGVGPGIGTFLVSYSGLTGGGIEFVQVVRIDSPLGVPSFVQEYVAVGDLEGPAFPALPDAPQAGTATLVEVNDRRALHAVWRNNKLWLTATILPNAGTDLGQTTAYWWRLSTSAVPAGVITPDDQGTIGAEDIATGTYTFFPSIAVDGAGNMKVGFSASAPTIFPGAFFTGREPADPAGTVQATEVLRPGLDYYIRTFGGPRNRWGDYSGISVDPTDDATFWIFNEYALPRGTLISGEDGRWGTAWGSSKFGGTGGTILALGDEDAVAIKLPFIFPFCGVDYDSVYVYSNGYVSFGQGFISATESIAGFIGSPPRIAVLWDDLDPSAGGTITAGPLGSDFAVSFLEVPEAATSTPNSFSIILRPDGSFRLDYGVISATDALVGRSRGPSDIDAGELDLSIASQPITSPNAIYELFTGGGVDDVDLSGMSLEFEPCQEIKPIALLADKIIIFSRFIKVEGEAFSNRDVTFFPGKSGTLKGDLTAFRDVILDSANTVDGDLTAGGTATLDPDATVTGTVTSGASVTKIPLPVFTWGPFSGPAIQIPKGDSVVIAPGDYNRLRADSGAVMRLSSGTYNVNRFIIDGSAKVKLDLSGGPVTINVVDRLSFRPASQIVIESVAGSSEDIFINFKGIGAVECSKKSKLQGNLTAPNARVVLGSSAGFWGAISANRIDVKANARVRHHSVAGGIPKTDEDESRAASVAVVKDYTLEQNYPNPFNPSTKIIFALPQAGHVKLEIYDLLGNLVNTLVDGAMNAGRHEWLWNSRNAAGETVAAGIYLYRLTAQRGNGEAAAVMTKRMILVK